MGKGDWRLIGDSVDFSKLHFERSKQDIKHFYEWLGYNYGNHIEQWMEMYEKRGDAQVHRVCIIAPRDHSKSTTLRVKLTHKCLFETWRNKTMTIWLFSASKDMAANRLEEIKADLRNHPELSKQIDESKSNRFKLSFTNGAWIKATSVGSAIRGEHPACVAMDDILADIGDMNMDTIKNWFRKVITPMLSPGTSLYVVGTPMSMTDIYHTEMLTNESWKSDTWSAFPNWDEYKADPENVKLEALWPEHRSVEFLIEQKLAMNDELAFVQEYLCKVIDDEAQVFKRSLIRKNMDMDATLGFDIQNSSDNRFVIGFDPSHGIGKDYSVMIVLRQDPEGYIHFVDMWRRNDFPPNRQVDMILEWYEKYYKPVFACEEVGFSRLYETLITTRNVVVNFQPSKVSNKGLKQALMNRVRVWFEQGKVVWPYGDHATRQTTEIILNELENHVWKGGEIVDVGKHNDTVMAFAHAIDQYSNIGPTNIPFASNTANIDGWMRSKSPKRINRRGGGKYVSLGE